jgi:hypothetical protein
MALDTFIVFANQYGAESDALSDYESVRKLYTDPGIIDTYDGAVLTRKADERGLSLCLVAVSWTDQPTASNSISDKNRTFFDSTSRSEFQIGSRLVSIL